jgi:hypothetical protein
MKRFKSFEAFTSKEELRNIDDILDKMGEGGKADSLSAEELQILNSGGVKPKSEPKPIEPLKDTEYSDFALKDYLLDVNEMTPKILKEILNDIESEHDGSIKVARLKRLLEVFPNVKVDDKLVDIWWNFIKKMYNRLN